MSQCLIDRVIKQYRTAIRLYPDYLEAYNNIGSAYISKDLIGRAIEQYIRAVSLYPNNSTIHENLGSAYRRKGMLDKAERHFETSKRLRKNLKE